jgi:hypothetical protein
LNVCIVPRRPEGIEDRRRICGGRHQVCGNGVSSKLDWTDESVRLVEEILEKLRASMPTPKPPDDMIWNFAKGFGSYVGEVFRKNHGGEWGMVTHDGQTFPGIRWKGNVLFWPWGRVHQRLVVGAESNVFDHYRSMVSA